MAICIGRPESSMAWFGLSASDRMALFSHVTACRELLNKALYAQIAGHNILLLPGV